MSEDVQNANVSEGSEGKQPVDSVKPKQEVRFSNEQQDFINKLINDRYTEAYKKAEAKYRDQFEAQKKEIDALKTATTDSKKKEEHTEDPEEVRQLRDKIAESERILETNRMQLEMNAERHKVLLAELESEKQARIGERKINALTSAAQEQDFIDPTLVVKLVEDLVKYDTDGKNFKVFNEQGQERWNEFMKPMTLKEFMAEFASTHKFLVRGKNTSGTGATEDTAIAGRKWTRAEIAALQTKPVEYEKNRVEILKAMKEGRVT